MDRTKANLIETYNRYALDRDKRRIASWKIPERDRFLQLLREESKAFLLDLGAGTGKDSKFFKDSGLKTVSCDISYEMVNLCREKGLPVVLMDFCSLGFHNESFDGVWALNSLLHVPKRAFSGVLEGIQAVLKPTGLLYIGMYGGLEYEGVWEDDYYTPHRFFSFYPDRKIQEVVAELFEILYFKVIPLKEGRSHFQSMILRNFSQRR